MGRNQRDEPSSVNLGANAWTTSNVTTDRSIDANSNDPLVNGDGLCTLIEDLKTAGILV